MRAELDSVRLAAHLTWPHLKRSHGSTVTVGSTAGLTGSLSNRRTAHSASKGAVIALTRQLAAEGDPFGIRANGVSPDMIDTEGSRGDLLAEGHPLTRHKRVHRQASRLRGLPDRRSELGKETKRHRGTDVTPLAGGVTQ